MILHAHNMLSTITHSYFSSPVTCPTTLRQFHSPFPRDVVFGSVEKTFHHKWHGNGYAYLHTDTETQQAPLGPSRNQKRLKLYHNTSNARRKLVSQS